MRRNASLGVLIGIGSVLVFEAAAISGLMMGTTGAPTDLSMVYQVLPVEHVLPKKQKEAWDRLMAKYGDRVDVKRYEPAGLIQSIEITTSVPETLDPESAVQFSKDVLNEWQDALLINWDILQLEDVGKTGDGRMAVTYRQYYQGIPVNYDRAGTFSVVISKDGQVHIVRLTAYHPNLHLPTTQPSLSVEEAWSAPLKLDEIC